MLLSARVCARSFFEDTFVATRSWHVIHLHATTFPFNGNLSISPFRGAIVIRILIKKDEGKGQKNDSDTLRIFIAAIFLLQYAATIVFWLRVSRSNFVAARQEKALVATICVSANIAFAFFFYHL